MSIHDNLLLEDCLDPSNIILVKKTVLSLNNKKRSNFGKYYDFPMWFLTRFEHEIPR